MANDAKTLFQAFLKKGLTDREALFAVLDHHARLHCIDRDRYDERMKVLEDSDVKQNDRLAALEKSGPTA